MQMEIPMENNSVHIAGEVAEECVFSHEVYGEGFYTFRISSKRLSDQEDILPVTVSERLVNREALQLGTRVEIYGQLRSYNNYAEHKNRLVLTIFAREISFMQEDDHQNPNEICLNGYICKTPVYRKTPFGREIADVLVAVNRAYHKSDYIPCIAWGRNARFMNNLKVGSSIKVWGRIQSRHYQKKMGEEVEDRMAYEVSISKIDLEREKEAE